MSTGDFRGIRVTSDLPQQVLDVALSKLWWHVLDACRPMVENGFPIDKIEIKKTGKAGVIVKAFPEDRFMVSYKYHTRDSKPVRAIICPECHAVYNSESCHPDDSECKSHTIDSALSV